MYGESDNSTRNFVIAVLFGVIALIGLVTLLTALRTVGTGQVGVVTQYGKTTGRELSEGLSWVAPWGVNNVTIYDVKTQKDEVQTQAATKDLQDVKGTLVLNYALERGEVSRMHQTVGKEYKDKLILPALNEVFKAASAKYTASELITNRAEAKQDVYNQLKERLNRNGIRVEDVSITNLQFGEEFNKAIEAVQIANQNVARARQELETTRVQAEKDIAAAQGQAEAQRLQQETLTPELVRLREIEAQNNAINKWNGVLPTTQAGDNSLFNIPVGR